ncbi:MAG: S8 family serine peptidase [Deltaproteobacteria bacterium]|nr:S8 family serine peptidase [Deltaproteobacteria bacterium]
MFRRTKAFSGNNMSWRCLPIVLVVLFLAVGIGLTGGIGNASAASGEPDGKLSARLAALAVPSVSQAEKQTLGFSDSGANEILMINSQGQILVYIRLTEITSDNLQALTAMEATIVHVSEPYKTVTAYVPDYRLADLTMIAAVANIQEVIKPERQASSCPTATISEGDSQLKADQARSFYNIDGTGVRVGVLSDSYALLSSPTSASQDVSTGDLPGTSNPCGHTTPVNVIAEGPSGGADEGRAMAQIVHDLAPGAKLAFATAFNGDLDFADQIRALRNTASCDIIVDDVSYANEPFFQDGPISVAVKDVTTNGAVYFTSAGNSTATDNSGNIISSYEAAAYRPAACPTVTGNSGMLDCHNFNTGGGTTTYMSFTLTNGGYIRPILQWNEPWYGVVTNLDLYITNAAGAILAKSVNVNTGGSGTQQPYEYTTYTNGTGANQTVYLVIARRAGTATPRVKYISIRTGGVASTNYNSTNSTDTFGVPIFGHAGANEALSIAAVPYNDSTSPESYTSRGYPTFYYGPVSGTTPASLLSSPQTRAKPDMAATDGGRNTFFGSISGGYHRFYGTSAAAPHAAAVTALLKQRNASLTMTSAQTILKSTASAIANGGLTITGAGLVNALAAMTPSGYYTVIFTAGSGGSISGQGNQLVASGGSCSSVTPVASSGYYFSGWTGDYTGSDNPLTLTNVTANKNITANFAVTPSGGGGDGGGGGGGCFINSTQP